VLKERVANEEADRILRAMVDPFPAERMSDYMLPMIRRQRYLETRLEVLA
jgi:hypothetical protein